MQECRRPPYRKLTRIATSVTNQKSVFWSVICLWTNQRPVLPLATVRRGFVESRHQHWWRSRSGRDLDPERHADTSLGLPHCILKLYSCRIKKNSLKSLKSLLHVINIYKQSFTTESWNPEIKATNIKSSSILVLNRTSHMHHLIQTPPYWLHWAHIRQLPQTRQPSLATQPDQQTISANPTLKWANGEI